jgi:hypothetical protein
VKPPAWLLWLVVAVAGLVAAFVFLRPAPAGATVGGMPTTLTKPRAKKPVRKTAPRAVSLKAPAGMSISPVTGLYFKPLKPGQKTVSREVIKAALADSL